MIRDDRPRWKRYHSPRFLLGKVRERGVVWCVREYLVWILRSLRRYPAVLKNVRSVAWPSAAYTDSVLAVYDFRASTYDYSFTNFLANSEVYRLENSLSRIDVVMVVDRKKRHRGDQPEVTESNYRNWILNLAECADLLRSVSSLSIFDDEHKFLSFYHRARYTHKVCPNVGNPVVYEPRTNYNLRPVADFFHRTGHVPRFESSGVLLEWAERYFLQNSYPMLPVVVIVRNSKTHPDRNTDWPEWLKFFQWVRCNQYPVRFFVVNDFWNPVVLPDEYRQNVCICVEATISTKYRQALLQRASLFVGQGCGPFFSAVLMNTPFLMFGLAKSMIDGSLDYQKEMNGYTDDWQLPWLSKYQKMLMGDDAEFITAKFAEMYALLEGEQRLTPAYWPSPIPGA